jgi:hypothetical protein
MTKTGCTLRTLFVADEIEKELDGAPVRAERLRACPDSRSDVGRAVLKSAARPASVAMRG